mgnify:CR=1 FL=1
MRIGRSEILFRSDCFVVVVHRVSSTLFLSVGTIPLEAFFSLQKKVYWIKEYDSYAKIEVRK